MEKIYRYDRFFGGLILLLFIMIGMNGCNARNDSEYTSEISSNNQHSSENEIKSDKENTEKAGAQRIEDSSGDAIQEGQKKEEEIIQEEITQEEITQANDYIDIFNQDTSLDEEMKESVYDLTKVFSESSLQELYQPYFRLGVMINGDKIENNSLKSIELASIMRYHFNSLTFSDLMNSCCLLDEEKSRESAKAGNGEPVLTFDPIIEGLEFAKENKIHIRGHVLISNNKVPEWFFRRGYNADERFASKAEMLRRMESYIRQVMEFCTENYPGIVDCYDVVDGAIEVKEGFYDPNSKYHIRTHYEDGDEVKENLWYQVIGEEYVEKAFEYARKYAGEGVALYYNENNAYDVEKMYFIYQLLLELKNEGLIDGFGMQGDLAIDYPGIFTGENNLRDAIIRYASLNLELQITELTVRCDDRKESTYQKQGARYEQVFELLLNVDTDCGGVANITGVTFLGVMDQYLFYEESTDYYGLLDNKLQPKPAFYRVLETGFMNQMGE